MTFIKRLFQGIQIKLKQGPGGRHLHAGGAPKNQKVDKEITLPPGSYTLHYKSDSGRAFNSRDSPPPDLFFWGIMVLELRNKSLNYLFHERS